MKWSVCISTAGLLFNYLNCLHAEAQNAQAPSVAGSAQAFVETIPGTSVSFKMVPIPAGVFTMGSPDREKDHKADEGPLHEVKVEPFLMEEHEVTWGEYDLFLDNYSRLGKASPIIPKDKFADAVTYPTPLYDAEAAPIFQRMGGRGTSFPAVIMSQFAARQYTKWLSKKTGHFYRLPSEAEWEYAARAGTKTAYFFGDDRAKLGEYAWFAGNSNEPDGETGYHPVMQKKPNPLGLYDIYGNAAEWCVDQYAADWYQKFTDKPADAEQTIHWPTERYSRVLRGGDFDAEPADCRSASRRPSTTLMNAKDPQFPKSPHWMSDGFFIGFRLVSPAKEPGDAEKIRWWNADDKVTASSINRDHDVWELVQPGAATK